MTSQVVPERNGIVIYYTRYGNTEKIARSFEIWLKQVGIQTDCVNAKETSLESLKEFDLIAVGAPTEKITASKSIKEFLEKLKSIDLSGKCGFAFDTRLPFPLSGSAAKYIEKELKHMGLLITAQHSSAIVSNQKEAEGGIQLKEGEEKRFEQVGLQVGTAFLASRKEVIPA